ncbi:MAG: hypothetical protein KF787_08920 [Phycisphaeraceae bacterium]|nr:hypothetical protein [Phycisphaeraceae bacterium]
MRHPLLRILVALLIGVWSPLCCCQAMALAGNVCEGTHQIKTDSCCHEESHPGEDETPANHGGSLPVDCPSCPSCQGTSGGAGLTAEAKLPTLEQKWNALATIALAVLFDLPQSDEVISLGRPPWWNDPPFVKANREALRWHCALIV